MKPFLLQALTAVTAFKYDDTKSGHCPFKPGEIKVEQEFVPSMLEGVWLNIYDRVDLKEHMKCYSAKFQSFEDNGVFQYSTMSHHLNDNIRKREGMNMKFDHIKDANNSVGMIENMLIDITSDNRNDYKEMLDRGHFDANLFEAQFLRYAQIIDTDNLNYIVKYQCLETAQYVHKSTSKELTHEQAASRSKAWIDTDKRPVVEFQFSDEIQVNPLHYEDIQILWRPFVEETQQYNEYGGSWAMDVISFPEGDLAPTDEKVEAIKNNISKVFPDGRFSAEMLSEHYGLQDHVTDGENTCQYDPMSVTQENHTNEYYGIMGGPDGDLPKADLFFSHQNEL